MADLRQACDRCHGKKLRCSRQPGARACTRCDRASTACIFSPPTKQMRNVPQAPPTPDWIFGLAEPSNSNVTGTLPSSEVPLQNLQAESASSGMSLLTAILQSADQIYSSLPGEELYHIPQSEVGDQLVQMSQLLDLQTTLERFMQMLQQLELLYPVILERAASRDLDFKDFCKADDCIHHTAAPRSSKPPSEHPNQFDYTLVQLLLSCHQRLLDITEAILGHGGQCFDQTKDLPPEDMQLDVPEVRIGALTVSKPTATSFWMKLLQDSLSALQKHLGATPGLLGRVRVPVEEQAQIIELQSKVISRRTQAAMQDLGRLRKGLIELDVITS